MTLPIIIDCDGVLADFTGHMAPRLGYLPQQVDHYEFFRDGPKHKAFAVLCALRSTWAALRPMAGAQEGISQIRAAGLPFVVATAPWHSCDGWASTRYAWLEKHFDIKPRDVIIGAQKHLLRGAAMIEDKPETLEAWEPDPSGDDERYLYPASYNFGSASKYRGCSWSDGLAELVIESLRERLQ